MCNIKCTTIQYMYILASDYSFLYFRNIENSRLKTANNIPFEFVLAGK